MAMGSHGDSTSMTVECALRSLAPAIRRLHGDYTEIDELCSAGWVAVRSAAAASHGRCHPPPPFPNMAPPFPNMAVHPS